MSSIVLPLAIGIQMVDRQMLGPGGYHGNVLEAVAAIFDRRRTFVVFALVMEGIFVETLEKEFELLLEQFAIGLRVEERCAERFHLARMIAATDPHDDAPVGNDVGHRVVLGEADRVPHRQNIEGAAELEPLGLRREPQSELDQIGQALVTLPLEVMLGRPTTRT